MKIYRFVNSRMQTVMIISKLIQAYCLKTMMDFFSFSLFFFPTSIDNRVLNLTTALTFYL